MSTSTTARRRTVRHNLYDLGAVFVGALLFLAALLVGRSLQAEKDVLQLNWPPLYANWSPHIGPGTVPAVVLAALTVGYGPLLARRLPWRWLVPVGWAAALAWTWSLTLIDGWHQGLSGRMTTKHEYLQSVGEVDSLHALLRGFTDHILWNSPHPWPTHVAGHPPGALLTFVGLDRIGLAGGLWAAVFVLVTASSAIAAVLLTLRALTGEDTARRAAPFLVLAPAAVWMGVCGDAWFTAVGAWAMALLALAATRRLRTWWPAALASGLLFGLLCYLSYGLTLLIFPAVTVLFVARALRPLPVVLLGVAVVVAAFTAAGFWWFDGYSTLVTRYYQGAGGTRPYGYFVWANLAVQAAVLGPAVLAGLRRATAHALHRPRRQGPLLALIVAAALSILVADLSGMSKAETERIWLPFTLWLHPAAAFLPRATSRWWLAGQGVLALAINHLLNTGW